MDNKKQAAIPEIDFVIPWVDGSDPAWLAEKARYSPSGMPGSNTSVRFRDWDNLQYWFRGVEKFAPWVRRIHFITWGHLPKWLKTDDPRLHIVNHRDYIPEKYLPTFNTNPIELNIHRIEGLSEQFVYFNDDMFLTGFTKPEDFFKKGLPCDTAGLNCIQFSPDSSGHFNGSNLEVINTEFDGMKKSIIRRNRKKWFSLKNGFRNDFKTFLLLPWEWFPGFYYDHLPSDFLKSTLCEVWEKYPEILDKTCSDKFRRESNVTQWLFKYWQLCKGDFEVRSYKFGKAFHINEDNFNELCQAIVTQKYRLVCINDTASTRNFEEKKRIIIECFEKILPEKSSFEL